MTSLGIFVIAACTSAVLTRAVLGYARKQSIIDVPNKRSLHRSPVPRGGGLAIVLTILCGTIILAAVGVVPFEWLMVTAGGAAVAVAGWLDDRSGVRRRTRALVHFAAAAWALWWLGGLPVVTFGAVEVRLAIAGSILAAIGIVWWTNLYNFMDGIDGLAGAQALSVPVAAGVLMLLSGADSGAVSAAFLVAGAAAGFLLLNWSPARIFMGDVGSGFLGFTFATLAIATELSGALPLVVWLLLSGVFLFDSTVTLVRRVLRGDTWWEAHRLHAYQRLVTSGLSHALVTCGVVVINAVLAGAAYYAVRSGAPMAALTFALAVLAAVYLWAEQRQPMPPAPTHGRAPSQGLARRQPNP